MCIRDRKDPESLSSPDRPSQLEIASKRKRLCVTIVTARDTWLEIAREGARAQHHLCLDQHQKLDRQGKIFRRMSSPRSNSVQLPKTSRQLLVPNSSNIKVRSTISQQLSVCPFLSLEVKGGQLRALVDSCLLYTSRCV